MSKDRRRSMTLMLSDEEMDKLEEWAAEMNLHKSQVLTWCMRVTRAVTERGSKVVLHNGKSEPREIIIV